MVQFIHWMCKFNSHDSSFRIAFQNYFQILDKLEKSVIIDEVLPLLTEIKLNDVNILLTMLGEDRQLQYYHLLATVGRDVPRDAERQEVRADGGGAGHPRAARAAAAAGQPAARPGDVPGGAVHRAGTVLYCTVLYCTVL